MSKFKIPNWNREWQYDVRQSYVMDTEVMKKNLLDIKTVFDKYDVTFVLMGGGLLGAVREGKFITYDYDLDLACFSGTEKKDHWKMRWVKDELEELGFFIVDNSCCRCKSDFFIRGGERVDLFWFEKIDQEWIYSNTLRYPEHYFDNLKDLDFLGTQFKVPQDLESFLEYNYGKDWRIPNEKFHSLNLNPKEVEKRSKQ